MSWPKVPLDQLGHVSRGRSRHRPRNDPSLYGGSYPFIQTADVKHADLRILKHQVTYNDTGLAQSRLWPRGTLCITIAANIADTALLDYEACFPDSVIGFIADPDKADPCFVKYFFDTIQRQLQLISQGATQDNLNQEKLLSFGIACPPIDTQKQIACVLSSYDDLVATNQRRIALLEEAARHLYREWFVHLRFPGHETVKVVDGVPDGWSKRSISEVAEVNACSIGSKEHVDAVLYVDISSVTPGCINDATSFAFADAPGRARRKVKHGDVIWSCVRPNRRSYALVWEPDEKLIVSTGFAVLTATDVPFSYLYFVTTTDDFVGHLEQNATGAAYPAVTAKTFENSEILVPTKKVLEDFDAKVLAMLEQMEVLKRQNSGLAKARDSLLPKLMSGKVDVSGIELPKEDA